MARTPPPALLTLQAAISAHDLDALCACFAPEYRNETPAHPARSFRGREHVRRNWTTILASVPDLTAELVRWSGGRGEPLWAEWNWSGTRPDGAAVHLAGVTVLGLEDGDGDGHREVIRWARFYMEPVDDTDNDAGIGRAVGRRPERSPAVPR
jgi:ketosteroid isomerase-like protein